jgi:AcrR family transcriptional regulator
MIRTKEKILQASIKLFNEQGVASTRLQQIADDIGISVGNLAYHFKSKEAIVQSVYEKLFGEFNEILGSYLNTPNLLDFDLQLAQYFDFFKEYQFYISDLFSSEHPIPEIRERWQLMMDKMIAQIKKRLDFHVKRGDLIQQPSETYELLAETLWITLIFWIPQQNLRNKPVTKEKYKIALWNNIKPYLTSKGMGELSAIVYSFQ